MRFAFSKKSFNYVTAKQIPNNFQKHLSFRAIGISFVTVCNRVELIRESGQKDLVFF
jgi:hypothetical protein